MTAPAPSAEEQREIERFGMFAEEERVEKVADALRRRARDAFETPCDMDCDPEDCASCGQPIQGFSFINDVPDTIFGDVEAIAAAAIAADRHPAEEAVRRVEALAEELEEEFTETAQSCGVPADDFAKVWRSDAAARLRAALNGSR